MFVWSRLRGYERSALLALAGLLVFLVSSFLSQPQSADAARDERTISLYEIHLKETTTITFKRDGKYIPSALKEFNYAMRCWRNGEVIRMDPKLLNLVWQLHKDVGATGPVHVVSGHRSAITNRRLRRRGGGQAKKSQHILGRAMDINFPGVSMSDVRKAAFKLEVGGVGYYPTSALPFVHVDTARVRSWPRMSRSQLAMIFPYGRTKHLSTSGRLTLRDQKRARVRLAAIARKKANRARILLARNSTPPQERRNNFQTPTKRQPAITTVVAALANQTVNSPTLEVPGLSRDTRHLWVNQAGNRTLPKAQAPQGQQQVPVTRPRQLALNTPAAPRPVMRQRPAQNSPGQNSLDRNWRKIHKRIQLASLTPQTSPPVRPQSPTETSKLWVDGADFRATWLQSGRTVTKRERTVLPATQPLKRLETTPNRLKHTTIRQRTARQNTSANRYQAERVAYAPSYDEEHPDELAYRPFKILPLMSTKPVALNKTLVAMTEPRYDRVFEVIASSENLHMQFRPSASDAAAMWNSQFKGKAIINIRNQALNRSQPARPTRMASR